MNTPHPRPTFGGRDKRRWHLASAALALVGIMFYVLGYLRSVEAMSTTLPLFQHLDRADSFGAGVQQMSRNMADTMQTMGAAQQAIVKATLLINVGYLFLAASLIVLGYGERVWLQSLFASSAASPRAAQAPFVKVRCRSCGNLEGEAAKFCSACGAAV